MKKLLPAILGTLVLATAASAYAATPARMHPTGGSWYAIADAQMDCFAARRLPGVAEEKLAGPFATEAQADSAANGFTACQMGPEVFDH